VISVPPIIQRTKNWNWVREFLLRNLASIGCGLEQSDVLRFEPLVRDSRNWFVRCKHGPIEGIWLFLWSPGEYEVHACTDRLNWGGAWVGLGKCVLRWFSSKVVTARLVTHAPIEEREANRFAAALGFRIVGEGMYPSRLSGLRRVSWFLLGVGRVGEKYGDR
jgi:hypothetical protein